MKKAIEYLRNLGYTVTDSGLVVSELPEGEEGITFNDKFEEETGCIININQIEEQED
jgi:hypothetical protein